MFTTHALALGLLIQFAIAQTGVVAALAQACNVSLPRVLCIDKYASVMPYQFFRPSSNGTYGPPFGSTSVPNDTSFAQVNNSDFLVFDRQRGLELLGPSPSYDFIFSVSSAVHEAPVYVAAQNKIYFSQLAPPAGYLPQLVIDLNQIPPTLSEYLSDPPVYAPNGGTFHSDLIYWGVSGGNDSIGGIESRPGLSILDPASNKTSTLLNNFFGHYFNTVDDLFVHPITGDVWFTDPDYSWFNRLSDTPPRLPTASYRFRPSTGAVNVVDDTLLQPNGIAISPSFSTIYISDTGAVSGSISPIIPSIAETSNTPGSRAPSAGASFNATGPRTIYAFDVGGNGTYLCNKRTFYLSQDWVPDGLKVAANGYVVTATGRGVDVLDEVGTLLVRVQTNFTVNNFVWGGPQLDELWLTGSGGVARAKWGLKGQVL